MDKLRAVLVVLGGKDLDPFCYGPSSPESLQQFIEDQGIEWFSAKEVYTPHRKALAKKLGFKNLLPPLEYYVRLACLLHLADGCRQFARSRIYLRNYWRPEPYNTAVKGSKGSDHVEGFAVDLDYATAGACKRAIDNVLMPLYNSSVHLGLSLGLGKRTTHVGIGSPAGHRIWYYD